MRQHHLTTLAVVGASCAATAVLAGCGGSSPSPSTAHPNGPIPPGAYVVTSYGADPTGHRDSSVAIAKAIEAAESGPHHTVYIPAGRYLLDDPDRNRVDFVIDVAPVTIMGAGAASTDLVQEVGAKLAGVKRGEGIFQISPGSGTTGGDGTVISGLTLDSASYDGGTTILDTANDTTLRDLVVHGPRSSHSYNRGQFGVRVIAICNHDDLATVHRSGNRIQDVSLTGDGAGGNTDLDISCQEGATVSDITDTGNGIDIYISDDVTVDGLTFHPGPGLPDAVPYVITPPADDITLEGVTTYGSGGRIQPSPHGYHVTGVDISHEVMQDRTDSIYLGDATRTTITDSQLGVVQLAPSHGLSGLTVTGSSVASVSCSDPSLVSGLVGLRCGA